MILVSIESVRYLLSYKPGGLSAMRVKVIRFYLICLIFGKQNKTIISYAERNSYTVPPFV